MVVHVFPSKGKHPTKRACNSYHGHHRCRGFLCGQINAVFGDVLYVRVSDEPRAWWYEIFETCRRILLTSLVFFATRTSMQLWIAMGFTVVRSSVLITNNVRLRSTSIPSTCNHMRYSEYRTEQNSQGRPWLISPMLSFAHPSPSVVLRS